MMIERRSRPDRAKAIAVHAGIAMLNTDGHEAAAEFLEGAGVAQAVVDRVLNEPDKRRAADRG